MNCPACGFTQSNEGNFCNNCGTPFRAYQPQMQVKKGGFFGKVAIGVIVVIVAMCGIGGLFLAAIGRKATQVAIDEDLNSASPSATALTGESLRIALRESYALAMNDAHSHLNYIAYKITKVKGGYALMAYHSYFSRFTLDIGNTSKIISAWISLNRDDLKTSQIVRVGVANENGNSSAWLTVE